MDKELQEDELQEQISLLLDYFPSNNKTKKSHRVGKLYDLVHGRENGFLLLMVDIYDTVSIHPELSFNDVFDELGLGAYKHTIWQYLRKNVRFLEHLYAVRKCEMDALVTVATRTLRDIINDYQSLKELKQASVVVAAIKLVLDSEAGKSAGFGGAANKDMSVVLIDKTTKSEKYSKEQLDKV